jgi:hypothetical protein
MNRTYFLSIPCVLAILLVVLNAYLGRVRHVSRKMRAEFDRLLDRQTVAAKSPCERLLEGIDGSRLIADSALRVPSGTQDLQRALREILTLLNLTVAS